MAKSKRKRNNKQPKNQSSQVEPEPEPEIDELYEAKAILDERKKTYLIDWAGRDSRGKPYRPTWEPKENANDALVQEWNNRLAAKKRKRTSTSTPDKRATRSPSKAVESTPASSVVEGSHPSKRRRLNTRQFNATEIDDSQQSPTKSPVHKSSPFPFSGRFVEDSSSFGPSPQVEIPALPSSLETFERIDHVSEVPSTAPELLSNPAILSVPQSRSHSVTSASKEDIATDELENPTSQIIPDSQAVREAVTPTANSPSAANTEAVSGNSSPIADTEAGVEQDNSPDIELPQNYTPTEAELSNKDLTSTVNSLPLNPSSQSERDTPVAEVPRTPQHAASISELSDNVDTHSTEVESFERDPQPSAWPEHNPTQDTSVSSTNPATSDVSINAIPQEPEIDSSRPQEAHAIEVDLQPPTSPRPNNTTNHGEGVTNEDTFTDLPDSDPSPPSSPQLEPSPHFESQINRVSTHTHPDMQQNLASMGPPVEGERQEPSDDTVPPAESTNTVPASTTWKPIANEWPSVREKMNEIRRKCAADIERMKQEERLKRQLSEELLAEGEHQKSLANAVSSSESITPANAPTQAIQKSKEISSQPEDSLAEGEHQKPLADVASSSASMLTDSTPAPWQPITNEWPAVREKINEMRRKRDAELACMKSQSPLVDLTEDRPISALPPNVLAEKNSSTESDSGDVARSPSAVPAIEPELEPTKDEMNTSERYDTLLPQASDGVDMDPIVSSLPSDERSANDLGPWYTVAIPFVGHQRDHYKITVDRHSDLISRFRIERNPTAKLFAKVEHFLKRLRDIARHPDLENVDALTQYLNEPRLAAQWSIDSSSKFRFLFELLNRLRTSDLTIFLMTKDPNLAHMLTTFLEGRDFDDGKNDLIVKVVSPEEVGTTTAHDVLISMEPVEGAQLEGPGSSSPLAKRPCSIMLVVPHSIEHVELSSSPLSSSYQRTAFLLTSIQNFAWVAGKLETRQANIVEAAEKCASYIRSLRGPNVVEWPFANLALLEDPSTQTQTAPSSSLPKRPIVEVEASELGSNKKARVDSSAAQQYNGDTIDPQDLEITHVSDSLGKATQGEAESEESLQNMRQLLRDGQARVEDHVKALEDLQFRYEEQRNEIVRVNSECTKAVAQAQQALQRLTAANKTAQDLRDERAELKNQLRDANQRLQNHTIPERREIEAMHARVAQAEANEAKAKKDMAKTRDEIAFVRSSYQDASSQAQELAESMRELESRCAKAEKLAAGEQARALELSRKQHSDALERQNRRLKLMIQNHERSLKAKDEEIARLREAGRGRMSTRGSSVPRSPRLGSPIKGRGSRQTSPSAGDLRVRVTGGHPLRNG